MDCDGDGVLSEKELFDGLRDNGYNIGRDQVRSLIKDLDKNKDGRVNFEEFIKMFDIWKQLIFFNKVDESTEKKNLVKKKDGHVNFKEFIKMFDIWKYAFFMRKWKYV